MAKESRKIRYEEKDIKITVAWDDLSGRKQSGIANRLFQDDVEGVVEIKE